MDSGEDFDEWDIIKQVLSQLVFLESLGYYHDDIQQHNILYDNGKVHVIDYESITRKNKFHNWPDDLLQAFFIFMNCVFEKRSLPFDVGDSKKLLINLKKYVGQQKYSKILSIKDTEKFFAKLYQILFETKDDEIFDGYTAAENELLAVETCLEALAKSTRNLENNAKYYVNLLAQKIFEQQQQIDELEKKLDKLTSTE